MAAYWKIAAHSAYDMFSMYKYLIAYLNYSRNLWLHVAKSIGSLKRFK